MPVVVNDFKLYGKWVKTFRSGSIQYITKSASKWYHMKTRCKTGGTYQESMPTYKGCEISKEFLDFNNFAEWHTTQIGYGNDSYQLDKDLLVEGNKIYGSDFCCLLPKQLNSFLTFREGARGLYALGVSFDHLRPLPYIAQMSTDGEHKLVGYYATELDAHLAYREAKESEARKWADKLVAGIDVDVKVIERLKTWTLPVRFQFNKGKVQ